MTPIVIAITAMLWLLSLSYIVFTIRYQYMTRNDKESSQEVKIYKWVVTLGSAGIFVLTSLQFMNEFDFFTKNEQIELGLIWRIIFVAKIILAFWAVGFKTGRQIVPLSILLGVIVYISSVLHK